MPRTLAEAQAEYDALKGAGGRWWSTPAAQTLRDEIKALSKPPALPAKVEAAVTVTPASPPSSPFDSDEWRFVEKTLAETTPPDGQHQLKKFYQVVQAKVKTWRLMRSIVSDLGVGSEWPYWGHGILAGRNADTGAMEAAKPTPVLVSRAPQASAPLTMLPLSGAPAMPGPMPQMPGFSSAGDEAAAYKESVASQVAAMVSSRPTPQRTLETATA